MRTEARSRRHASAPEIVVTARGNYAGYGAAVSMVTLKDIAAGFAKIDHATRVQVRFQVLVEVVDSIVRNQHLNAGAAIACIPGRLDPDGIEMPLAWLQGVAG